MQFSYCLGDIFMTEKVNIDKLYGSPLPSTRTGMFYNAFAYPTKISPETIAVYIATHTKPNDVVLDVFGGSGSTGLAALMCEHPTSQMKKIAEDLEVAPVWGARNAVVYEIGKYGSFASNIMCNPPNSREFSESAKEFFSAANKKLAWLYSAKDPAGADGCIRHIVWSDVLNCPNCNKEISYYQLAVERNPMQIKKNVKCPHCMHSGKIDEFLHAVETIHDNLLKKDVLTKKRVPVLVYGQTGSQKWVRDICDEDIALLDKINALPYYDNDTPREIEWGDLYRSGYHTGITHLHQFYTKRNYYVMYTLWEMTLNLPSNIGDALRLLLLSYNSAHSTLMTRVVLKKNSKDFVLTSSQSGVLYISNLPVEKNIITGIKRKLKNFVEAFDYVNKCNGTVKIVNKSSEKIEQASNSIDYIFTDPPFGDYIPYAEINQINELWLGKITERQHEVIISPSQNKTVDDYEAMMTNVFKEMNRVLKEEAFATVVFHSSRVDVWNAVCNSLHESNLMIQNTSFLNKTQLSFKQVVSEGSVQGDPVMLLSKGISQPSQKTSIEVLDEVISSSIASGNKNVRLIYSNYLTTCLDRGVQIKVGAKEAYDYTAKKVEAL